ncbi:MAG: bifunctional 3-deoxy-7-phosphoheptulonate synthase/chorismate mutase type II [Muribaculaceae bacterium]|nr:bifunctional 3-deoxy-7-phosphoheptulonate synthase/chorismate mutase type II [Muribaculaceae bacterium]
MRIDQLQPLFSADIMGAKPIIMAGPCSAESERQTLETAQALAGCGIKIFRAGVWKPRTKPGGFEGVGALALEWLSKVKAQTGMLIATEVATSRHLQEAIDAGIDVIWLGARTTTNPFAVQEIADALSTLAREKRESLAVLVKNPVNPDLELWIGALERIYGAGVRRLGAIHRGFSSYGKHVYRNQPRWGIPIELHRRHPALPIICDPSHIGGKRELIAPLSQQALDMNFDGLIVESHFAPDEALSDASQQVTPKELSRIIGGLIMPTETQSTESIGRLRQQIDRLDDELLDLLSKRMRISREIGRFKREHNMPIVQAHRYNDLMQKRVAAGSALDMSADFIRRVLAAIHEESVRQQIEINAAEDKEE